MKMTRLAPDLILTNGDFVTLDAGNSHAQALAVKDEKILAIGADDSVAALADEQTKSVDLGGKMVIPGLFDSHNHLWEVGVKLTQIRLDECQSPAEMMELVREKATSVPPGNWIIGQGWNENNFSDGRLPTRADIDPATSDHPVILMRFFNMDVVNSVALERAGINRNTSDPPSGKIERDENGEPNGILRAAAKQFVRDLLPNLTVSELSAALAAGCRHMNSYGITSVIDPGLRPYIIRAYQRFYQSGGLTVRMNLMPSWHGFYDDENPDELDARARQPGIFSGMGDEWLRIGGLKMAIDGGTSSRTAFMYQPFEGESEVRDYNRLSLEQLYRYFRDAQELGWDVGIHATGDRAMDMAVDTFAKVARDAPHADARHNIIHAYFPSDRAIEQMAAYQIGAVAQPTFIYWEGDMIFRDVGHERAKNYKPIRKFLDHGIPVAANSDVPSTASVNPFVGLYALVTRRNNAGNLVAPDQAISREEALRAYAIDGTWLTREEHLKGSLEPGKLADMVVLDRDYFAVPDEEIKEITPTMTIAGGKAVYSNNS